MDLQQPQQQHLDAVLLAALRAAPRRYRLPPLPVDAEAAVAGGTQATLAFAIEAARTGPAPGIQALFTRALAQLIREALAPERGDPAFQAAMLHAQDAQVHEHVQLSRQRAADRRTLRMAIDAIAHPGKLRREAAGALRDALARLHGLAAAGAWAELAEAIGQLLAQELPGPGNFRAPLEAIHASPALRRLVRGSELLRRESVQRYQALCERRGPLAGSDAAAAEGRASAQQGRIAEHAAVEAFREIAGMLNRHCKGAATYRVARGLRTPRGFPGEASKAKEEWDAAIVRGGDAGGASLVLLAETKASPAAATSDFPRLLRGLRRLAKARADAVYAFASADGEQRIAGASLQGLRPARRLLPPHVIYCCSAPPEALPQPLGAATRAVLLAEPASLAFAQQLARGEAPSHAALAPVWHALATAPRLQAALHQYETAQKARAAMLHPDDLLASVAHGLQRSYSSS
uniref:3-deoxy-D-arabino-heptulosonate 7-phosphate synthase n=1 Tax=Variovorax paradoxus (strain S110) TaxID=543728 RepID=C5CLF1_VARPS